MQQYILSQRKIDGEIRYVWTLEGKVVGPEHGFLLLEDAAEWFRQELSSAYAGPERRMRSSEVDRRRDDDRRKRVSITDRRGIPEGRRFTDQIKKYARKGII